MAVVRHSFLEGTRTSPARRVLRESLSPDDEAIIRAILREWLADALVGRRMTEHSLRLFLRSGRLKNKAEVGSPHPQRTPELERNVWTINTTDPADLPIYGYAASEGDVRDRRGADLTRRSLAAAYGPARLIFDPAIRARSTITVGDSLWLLQQHCAAPSPVGNPSHLSWSPDSDFERSDIDFCDANQFVEVQILGRVYVEDVTQVVFDDEPRAGTLTALADQGFHPAMDGNGYESSS